MNQEAPKKPIDHSIDIVGQLQKNWAKVMKEEEEKYGKMPRHFDLKKGEYVEEKIFD